MGKLLSHRDLIKNIVSSELISGSSVAFSYKILGILASYIFTFLVTRNFGAEAMGVYSLSFTVLLLTVVVGRFGLDTALLRFISGYHAHGRKDQIKEVYVKSLSILVPLCLFLSFLLYYYSPLISEKIFHKGYLSPYFRIISFAVLPMTLRFINSESLRALKKIAAYSFIQNTAIFLLGSLILALLIPFFKGIHIPVLAITISIFVASGLSIYIWLTVSGINNVHASMSTRHSEMLSVAFPMLLSGSMLLIMHWTDTVMLGMFRSVREVGIYNIALKVAALSNIFFMSVNSIAAPKFAELFSKGDIHALQNTARVSTKLIFLSTLPVVMAIFIYPSFFMALFGKEFIEGSSALLILTFGFFVNTISGPVGHLLQMTKREKEFQYIILCATIINISLNYLLIPRYGINGAAIASTMSVLFINVCSIVTIKLRHDIYTFYLPFFVKM